MHVPDWRLEPSELVAFGIAFEAACVDLGLRETSLDVAKRESLAKLILGFVRKGEGNWRCCADVRSCTSDELDH
jgi:hypothetical protein